MTTIQKAQKTGLHPHVKGKSVLAYGSGSGANLRAAHRGEAVKRPRPARHAVARDRALRLADAILERVPDLDEWALDDEHLDETVDMIAGVLPRRSPWDELLGPFYTTHSLGKVLGVSRQAIGKRVGSGSLVRVRTQDGESLYPAFQVRDGVLVPGLGEVVQALRMGTDDEYSIAQWLATPVDGGLSPIERLAAGDVDGMLTQARHTAMAWAA